jgi:hypothetical protein
MFYLQPHISAIPGVREVLASPHVDENGRHTILLDKDSFKTIRAILTKSLQDWIRNYVSSDAQPTDEQFAGVARVKPIYDDGMSSGENSCMSSSNATFLSMELTNVCDDNYFNASTNVDRVITYADITMHHQTGKHYASIDTTITED